MDQGDLKLLGVSAGASQTYGLPRLQEFLRFCPFQSAATYPASRHGQDPRWRSAQPGPYNRTDLIGHFGNQVSRLPFDCWAISHPPLANIVSSSSRHSERQTKFHTGIRDVIPQPVRHSCRTSLPGAASPRRFEPTCWRERRRPRSCALAPVSS
jgi:hypothetical protein